MNIFKKIASCIIVSAIIVTTLGCFSVPSYGTDGFEQIICNATLDDNFTEDEILITVYPEWNDYVYTSDSFSNIGCTSVEEIFNTYNLERPSRILLLELATSSKQNVLDKIKVLEQREDIYCAEPNYLDEVCIEPNDPWYEDDEQWAIEKIDLPSAWNLTTGSSTVVVGVIDTGIDASHPDLADQINQELSCSFSPQYDNPLEDDNGHGTHVAGIIGAIGNNDIGVTGVCWNVELVSFRVDFIYSDGSTRFDTSGIAQAIGFAESNSIPILNYSGCGSVYQESVKIAIEEYSGLFVCSAGNNATDNDSIARYPANYDLDNIISVGNSSGSDGIGNKSNWGATTVDIFAPGRNILSTVPGGGYEMKSGTSMAAPFVTGVAALLLSQYPDMTAADLKAAIINHADSVSNFEDLCVSGGRLNAYSALLCPSSKAYLNTGSVHTHDCVYSDCGHSFEQLHTWMDRGTYYICSLCSMRSLVILAPTSMISELALASMAIDSMSGDNVAIMVTENRVLCLIDGQYYLVIAQSEHDALTLLSEQIESI